MTTTLYTNDIALRVSSANTVRAIQPGYAYLSAAGKLALGERATACSRISPRETTSEFWHWMDTQSVRNAAGDYQHNADLVYAQLDSLLSGIDSADLVIVVPSSYTETQLSMLLGIVKHMKLSVSAVVDEAVLHASERASHDQLVYLELYLHQAVVTTLGFDAGVVQKHTSFVVPGAGLTDCLDLWMRGIADLFVAETRFDPLHNASTEQQLFDQVYAAWGEGSLVHGIDIEIANRRMHVSRAQLGQWLGKINQLVSESMRQHSAPGAQLLIGRQIAGVPGLLAGIEDAAEAKVVADGTHALASIAIKASDDVVHITSLAVTAASVAKPGVATPEASHVLVNNYAHAIAGEGCAFVCNAGTVSRTTNGAAASNIEIDSSGHLRKCNGLLNGARAIQGAQLALGDVLTIEGVELRMIRVK